LLFGLLKEEAGEEVVVSPKFKLSPHQFEEIRRRRELGRATRPRMFRRQRSKGGVSRSCKPWASSVQNSPPTPSSQIRAKIEVWQEDIFRLWGHTGESLPLVERDMDVG